MGSPLNASYAEFFRFMLQFLCLQICVYGGSAVPQGGVGDRHLVTVPREVVGDRLPWGGERQGAGGGTKERLRSHNANCQRFLHMHTRTSMGGALLICKWPPSLQYRGLPP